MAYRYVCLDIIADAYCFHAEHADQKLTVESMPLYAVFENTYSGKSLPLRYEAIQILLRAHQDHLFCVGLLKSELLIARNDILRFEAEEELLYKPYSISSVPELSLFFSSDSMEDWLSSNILATSGGM